MKRLHLFALAAALVVVVVAMYLLVGGNKATSTEKGAASTGPSGADGVVIGYVAPTLIAMMRDAAVRAGLDPSGIQSIGSVEALRKIQQGNVPDLYASVDIELASQLRDVRAVREIFSLGRFKLALACWRPVSGPADIAGLKEAFVDPNKGPIGYRELAVVWMLKRSGIADLTARYTALGISFVETPSGVNITVPIALPSTGEVVVVPNLDGGWSQFETKAVDCIFTSVPFLINKGVSLAKVAPGDVWDVYIGKMKDGAQFYVYVFKPPYDFAEDPPVVIYANFIDQSGKVVEAIKVGHFEAFVASFTDKGDRVIAALKTMDLAAYGFIK